MHILLITILLFVIILIILQWEDIAQNYRYKTKTDIGRIKYLLKIVVDIFNHHNISYFVSDGTLLGIVRDKQLIPWDTDADLIILEKDHQKVWNVLQNNLPPGTLLSRGCSVARCIETQKNNWVDLYFYEEYGNMIRPCHYLYRWSNTCLSWLSNYFSMSSYYKKDVYPLKFIHWEDTMVKVPNQEEKILEDQYGSTWKTPIKRESWETVFSNTEDDE